MSSQYTNARRMASALSGSLAARLASVSSDSTTPQPNVSCGRLRSTTTISSSGAPDPPVLTRRVEKLYKIDGCRQPNDLQFVPDGLWVLDQVDPNKAFKIHPRDGSIVQALQTESIHGSGITVGNGALWISSTKMADPHDPPRTLKVDPKTGRTLKSWVTPGSGMYGRIRPQSTVSGAHGLKWVDGKYWMAVPASGKLFLMEPESGEIVRSIPAPGVRTHGLAWDNGFLWCVESNGRVIYT